MYTQAHTFTENAFVSPFPFSVFLIWSPALPRRSTFYLSLCYSFTFFRLLRTCPSLFLESITMNTGQLNKSKDHRLTRKTFGQQKLVYKAQAKNSKPKNRRSWDDG